MLEIEVHFLYIITQLDIKYQVTIKLVIGDYVLII